MNGDGQAGYRRYKGRSQFKIHVNRTTRGDNEVKKLFKILYI